MMLSNYVFIAEVTLRSSKEVIICLIHRLRNVGIRLLSGTLVGNLNSHLLVESIASAMIALGPTDDDLVRLGRRGLSREYANRMALVIVHIGMNALDVVIHCGKVWIKRCQTASPF